MSGYNIASVAGLSTQSFGWINANYRTMLNQRLFNALPVQLQAIAYNTPVVSRHATFTPGEYNSGSWTIDETRTDTIYNDYISIPSYQEVYIGSGDIDISALNIEANSKLPWASTPVVSIYNYENNNFVEGTDNNSHRYLTVRFKGAPIGYSPTIYKVASSVVTNNNTNVYNLITANRTLNVGDIWEPIGDSSGILYMYIGANEINEGISPEYAPNNNNILYCPTGGWVAAKPWWIRSASSPTSDYTGYENFMYVAVNGSPQTNNTTVGRYYIDYSIGF